MSREPLPRNFAQPPVGCTIFPTACRSRIFSPYFLMLVMVSEASVNLTLGFGLCDRAGEALRRFFALFSNHWPVNDFSPPPTLHIKPFSCLSAARLGVFLSARYFGAPVLFLLWFQLSSQPPRVLCGDPFFSGLFCLFLGRSE